jgi:hypothetical protein
MRVGGFGNFSCLKIGKKAEAGEKAEAEAKAKE